MKYDLIKKALMAEHETHCKNLIEAIEKRGEILQRESTSTRWNQYQSGKITYPELMRLTSERIKRKYQKLTAQDIERLTEIENAESPKEIVIEINWVKSRIWGCNPHAEITDGKNRYFGSASGCGYDKQSAAVSAAVNQSNRILHILAEKKESELQNGKTGTNHKLIGYGSGYSAIPKLEGGVGIESFRRIFENCGYEWKDYSGNNYDLYILTKREV